jgi:hypothetical protein
MISSPNKLYSSTSDYILTLQMIPSPPDDPSPQDDTLLLLGKQNKTKNEKNFGKV